MRHFYGLSALLLSMAAVPVLAKDLTPAEALERASGSMRRLAPSCGQPVLAHTETLPSGTAACYVFTYPGGGYAVLGADDTALPVWGYSDTGQFDAAKMPEAMKEWLVEMGRRMEWASGREAANMRVPVYDEAMTPIEPMVTTLWDQSAPFNYDAPRSQGTQCMTGCVATAMAQVMNYHRYPERGTGVITYDWTNATGKTTTLSLDLTERAFDWDHMLDWYGGGWQPVEGAAVSYLMQACGYSVEMVYNYNASGAIGEMVGSALRDWFGYDANCRYEQRLPHSTSEWCRMLWDNLNEVGPVLMNGYTPGHGGHSFVCDGYAGDGYFHFNWGWSGMCNGWFLIDVLEPDMQGIGGLAGGFNFNQGAALGIQPPTGLPAQPRSVQLMQYGSTTAKLKKNNEVRFNILDDTGTGWRNAMDCLVSVKVGAMLEPLGRNDAEVQCFAGKLGNSEIVSLEVGGTRSTEYAKINVTIHGTLEDGFYRLTLATLDTNDEAAVWTPVMVPYGEVNYALLEVSDGEYILTDADPARFVFTDLTAPGYGLYSGKDNRIRVKVSNPTDCEQTQGIAARLCDASGATCYTGSAYRLTLQPGEETEVELGAMFYDNNYILSDTKENCVMALDLVNPLTRTAYDCAGVEVNFRSNPGRTQAQASGFRLKEGLVSDGTWLDPELYGTVYMSGWAQPMTAQLDYGVETGFFDGKIFVDALRLDLATLEAEPVSLVHDVVVYPAWLAGESGVMEIDLPFDNVKSGEALVFDAFWILDSYQRRLGRFAVVDDGSSSVEATDAHDAVRFFNLQGVEISTPVAGEVVIEVRGSKSRKIAVQR